MVETLQAIRYALGQLFNPLIPKKLWKGKRMAVHVRTVAQIKRSNVITFFFLKIHLVSWYKKLTESNEC